MEALADASLEEGALICGVIPGGVKAQWNCRGLPTLGSGPSSQAGTPVPAAQAGILPPGGFSCTHSGPVASASRVTLPDFAGSNRQHFPRYRGLSGFWTWPSAGAMPAEIYFGRPPAHLSAVPPPRGRPGQPVTAPRLEIQFLDSEGHLPVLLRKAA